MVDLQPILGAVGVAGNIPWMGSQSITERYAHIHQFTLDNRPTSMLLGVGTKPENLE